MKQIPDDDNISAQFILSLFEEEEDQYIVRQLMAGVPAEQIVKDIVTSFCEGKND